MNLQLVMLSCGGKPFKLSMHMTVLYLIAKLMNVALKCPLHFHSKNLKITPTVSTLENISNRVLVGKI